MKINMEFYDKLNKGERHLVDWQLGIEGDFYTVLFKAICLADENNLNLLHKAFPEEVNAYKSYSRQAGWWQHIEQKILEGD